MNLARNPIRYTLLTSNTLFTHSPLRIRNILYAAYW